MAYPHFRTRRKWRNFNRAGSHWPSRTAGERSDNAISGDGEVQREWDPSSPALLDALAKNRQEARQAGALVEVGGLFPSELGARIRLTGGGLTVTDGPFTETRELVGGYSVYEVKSKQEVIEWTYRFMRVIAEHWPVAECEAEIRQIFEAPEFDLSQRETQ